MRGLLGSCFLPFISSWAGYCPSEGLCPYSLLGLLAINPAILLHCVCYSFIFPLTLITPWACWLMFLPYQLIDLLILYLGLPWSIYHIFTSHQFYRLIGHHSCHVSPFNLSLYSLSFLDPLTLSLPLFTPMGLLLYSLSFLSHFTTSLPLIILMGLLVIIPTASAH